MRKLLGYQLADKDGVNIQGDDEDPTGLNSFDVMPHEVANLVMQDLGDEADILLMPIFEGDVEEPRIIDPEIYRRIRAC